MTSKLSQLFNLALDISKLPVARLEFRLDLNPDSVRRMHAHFTKPHPRYKIFQNKSLGAALVDLKRFADPDEYMANMKGRNSAGSYARKARSRGYSVVEIDRNVFVEDIHEINTSLDQRQGRPMADAYRQKQTHFSPEKNYKYFGVLNSAGKLTAYSDIGFFGNFVAFDRLLGLRNNDGAMHLMVTEIICRMIESHAYGYLMYDTFFGASPGLRTFKTMLGFEPYRAKYSLQ
ncbi:MULTISPECIES: hypothetical protein [Massilia]|jgi:hypothetical protein|uniref:Uncharacterized protein n=1 Tax=Massilia orientalis TaxID=3050128 RepID=A0ACC7MAH1_9BURK|nr:MULTISPECIES: hypothetical protein [unclassified Massilia]KQY11983.1 hypothetical protein ASD28_05065 [Massilia sp. Root133]KQZ34530.1 hypothetical protein ASD92_09610 [Massilia sp. Root1485]MDN4043164.1 hypothetical protein [Massilia sp. YIM B02787]